MFGGVVFALLALEAAFRGTFSVVQRFVVDGGSGGLTSCGPI